jgi:hypothetical protein
VECYVLLQKGESSRFRRRWEDVESGDENQSYGKEEERRKLPRLKISA